MSTAGWKINEWAVQSECAKKNISMTWYFIMIDDLNSIMYYGLCQRVSRLLAV